LLLLTPRLRPAILFLYFSGLPAICQRCELLHNSAMEENPKIPDNKNMRTLAVKTIFFTLLCFNSVQSHALFCGTWAFPWMTETYTIVERNNWHRYVNGRYVGLISQEVRGTIIPQHQDSGVLLHQGVFFKLQTMIHGRPLRSRTVDAIIPVSFEMLEDDDEVIEVFAENDQGFPRLRAFPYFPARQLRVGSTWRAPGVRASNPFESRYPLLIPFIAEYEYRGIELFHGEAVHRLFARFGSNYTNAEAQGDEIARIRGGHRVDILIRVEDGMPVFMRDNFDVTYTKADGSNVRLRGFTLTFGSRMTPIDRGLVIADLEDRFWLPDTGIDLADLDLPVVDITPVPEGIRLTIRNIQFVPDTADFLPGEWERLDLIARALQQIPDRTFLVEGHTAATGRPESEMALSIERAERMIMELARRGIGETRFIYKGWGSTRPIGDNATEEGRSANRRVEITILE